MTSSLIPWKSMRLMGKAGVSPNPIYGDAATGAIVARISLNEFFVRIGKIFDRRIICSLTKFDP